MSQDKKDYFVHESAYVDEGAEIGAGSNLAGTELWLRIADS